MADTKREIPIDKDLMYQAQRKFPGYDAQAALTLYIIDQWNEQGKVDKQQNQLINAQKAENEKLRTSLSAIGKELDDHEKQAAETDREVERLKQLSARLKPAGEITQQAAKISADELQKIESQLEKIKDKPGINNERYNQLISQYEALKQSSVASAKEVKDVEAALGLLSSQKIISSEIFDKTMSELEKTRESLDAKEQRFQKYIDKTRGEREEYKSGVEQIKKYQEIFQDLDQKVKDINDQTQQGVTQAWAAANKAKKDLENIQDTQFKQEEFINQLTDLLTRMNPEMQGQIEPMLNKLSAVGGQEQGQVARPDSEVQQIDRPDMDTDDTTEPEKTDFESEKETLELLRKLQGR